MFYDKIDLKTMVVQLCIFHEISQTALNRDFDALSFLSGFHFLSVCTQILHFKIKVIKLTIILLMGLLSGFSPFLVTVQNLGTSVPHNEGI